MDISEKHNYLAATMAWIKANPKAWNQETWGAMTACGTVACLAGHGVIRAGGKLRFTMGAESELVADDVYVDTLPPDIREAAGQYVWQGHDPDGSTADLVPVSTAARLLFGIDHSQACDMFSSGNSMAELEAYVDAVVNGTEWPEPGWLDD